MLTEYNNYPASQVKNKEIPRSDFSASFKADDLSASLNHLESMAYSKRSLFNFLIYLDNSYDVVSPSLTTMARCSRNHFGFGVSVRTIRRHLLELVSDGYLKTLRVRGYTDLYYIDEKFRDDFVRIIFSDLLPALKKPIKRLRHIPLEMLKRHKNYFYVLERTYGDSLDKNVHTLFKAYVNDYYFMINKLKLNKIYNRKSEYLCEIDENGLIALEKEQSIVQKRNLSDIIINKNKEREEELVEKYYVKPEIKAYTYEQWHKESLSKIELYLENDPRCRNFVSFKASVLDEALNCAIKQNLDYNGLIRMACSIRKSSLKGEVIESASSDKVNVKEEEYIDMASVLEESFYRKNLHDRISFYFKKDINLVLSIFRNYGKGELEKLLITFIFKYGENLEGRFNEYVSDYCSINSAKQSTEIN